MECSVEELKIIFTWRRDVNCTKQYGKNLVKNIRKVTVFSRSSFLEHISSTKDGHIPLIFF